MTVPERSFFPMPAQLGKQDLAGALTFCLVTELRQFLSLKKSPLTFSLFLMTTCQSLLSLEWLSRI